MALGRWAHKILLLNQDTLLISFSKVFLFVTTHLAILFLLNALVTFMASLRGLDSLGVRIVVPTVASWYIFFSAKVGSELAEQDLFKLTLIYAYILLGLHLFINFKSIIKYIYGR